ncbi:MAG: putative toxin-antitoxin system toxin component, PIN family [Verrucomicrobiota bacterium]
MTDSKPRVVLDTNLLISRALTPSSLTASAVRLIIDHCNLMVSQATMDEFATTLTRVQSKGYVKQDEALALITAYKEMVEWIPIIEHVQECRDPKDDKFLDLAINGGAEYIITGDKDLLVLHPFRGTDILTAKDFLAKILR